MSSGRPLFSIGVDLGGTNCRAALVDLDRGVLVKDVKEPVREHGAAQVADLVAAVVGRLEVDAGGVGVGFAGMLRGTTGIVANAPNFGWRDVDLRGLLRARLGDRVELYNDLKAIAVGEHRYGAGRGANHMLCVYVGTGVGSALVLNGALYPGASQLAGEIGHTKVIPNGRLCGCGQHGCVEAYVSGRNIANRARAELSRPGVHSAAVTLAGGDPSQVHAGHLDQAAREDDPYARALWSEIAPLLGLALANAVTLLNPERMVLGGGVWDGAPELARLAKEAYRSLVNAASGEVITLVDTVLGDSAGMLGSATLIAESSDK